LKAAQLLERGFNSNSGLSWLMPSLGTVESLQPVDAAPPNLRDEMCGGHRKRPATEDEDEVIGANNNPDSPYGVFLSSLNPPKAKSAAALLQDAKMGEPVLVYTGTKPPAPGSLAAGDAKRRPPPPSLRLQRRGQGYGQGRPQEWHSDRRRPVRRGDPLEAEAKAQGPGATDPSKGGASANGDGTAAKPKPKPAPKDTAKDGASPTAAAGAAGDGATPKPNLRSPRRSPPRRTSPRRPSRPRKRSRRDDRRRRDPLQPFGSLASSTEYRCPLFLKMLWDRSSPSL
jgi:D-alanyl-D-alanine carboxypeptidase